MERDPQPELEHTPSVRNVKNRSSAKLCMLMLTHSCNYNCSYCYEKFKSNKAMSLDSAKLYVKEQVDFTVKSDKYEWLVVELFGGEPLLRFDLIQELVAWTRENVREIPVMFMITSNGSLLDDEKKEWFRKNRDMVVIGMSYDGSQVSQISNRHGFNESALSFCHEMWPRQSFRMTVSPESLPQLAHDILSSLRAGYKVRAEIAGGIPWSDHDREEYERQLRILKDAYLDDPDLMDVMLGRFFKGGEDSSKPCIKVCGSGVITTCYDVDGRKYPCQMFTPVVLGPGKGVAIGDLDFNDPSVVNDPECVGCPIKHWCPTCYGMNYLLRHHPGLRDHSVCKMNYTLALVTAEYQMEKLMKSPLSVESASLLKFLLRIHRNISERISASGQ